MSSETVATFPAKPELTSTQPTKAFERLWGKKVQALGYTAVPSIMIRAQHRLGVTPTQFCILVQLLDYWRPPERAPFPTKQQLADRIGVKPSTIKSNMGALEKAKLIAREQNKTAAGDWGANTYHLDGLVARLQALEPEFTEEKRKREQARRKVETPRGKRAAADA